MGLRDAHLIIQTLLEVWIMQKLNVRPVLKLGNCNATPTDQSSVLFSSVGFVSFRFVPFCSDHASFNMRNPHCQSSHSCQRLQLIITIKVNDNKIIAGKSQQKKRPYDRSSSSRPHNFRPKMVKTAPRRLLNNFDLLNVITNSSYSWVLPLDVCGWLYLLLSTCLHVFQHDSHWQLFKIA